MRYHRGIIGQQCFNMDHEFYFDRVEHRPLARLTPPQSAFGTWLTYEIGANIELLESAIEKINTGLARWQLQGREWLLECEEGEICLKHHSLFGDEFESDELMLDETALSAEAGAEDFGHLLEAWLEYIAR